LTIIKWPSVLFYRWMVWGRCMKSSHLCQ